MWGVCFLSVMILLNPDLHTYKSSSCYQFVRASEHSQGYEAGDGGGEIILQTHQTSCITGTMYIRVTVCVQGPGARGLLSGSAPHRSLCVTAAGTVVGGGKLESAGVGKRGLDGRVRSFEEIPHTGRNGWVNLLKFWREDRFRHLHKHMERTFNALGPIYR